MHPWHHGGAPHDAVHVVSPVRAGKAARYDAAISLRVPNRMKSEQTKANQDRAEFHEGFVHVVAPFETNTHAMELMEPRQRALDDPAIDAEAGAECYNTRGQALVHHGVDHANTWRSGLGIGYPGPDRADACRLWRSGRADGDA